jgi:hypothetical protein
MPPVDVLWGEMELAEYNAHMRRRLVACRQKIDAYKRKIQKVEAEMDGIEKQWDVATTLPRMFRRSDDDGDFWNRIVPTKVKYDPDLAGLVFQCCRGDYDNLPVQFLKMLWMDPHCPWRAHRNLLLATAKRIGGAKDVRIFLSPTMKADRDLVRACFANCPQALHADDGTGNNNGGVPLGYLQDVDMLRALLFSKGSRYYRSDACSRQGGIHHHFAKELWDDPALMADVVVTMCRATFHDRLAHEIVAAAFPEGSGSPRGGGRGRERQTRHPLLDDAPFALRVAAGMAGLPYPLDNVFAKRWPVTYEMLSPRLQANPDVALAYVRACPPALFQVPQALRNNERVWFELGRAATDNRPVLVYSPSLDANLRSALLSSKELVLRLLQEVTKEGSSKADVPAKRLEKFISVFPSLPPDVKADRDIHAQLVLLGQSTLSTKLLEYVAPECLHRRDFWMDLAEKHRCPCSAWGLVPEDVARDAALILVWARHARSDGTIDWLASALDRSPALHLLSDRPVVLNRMQELCGKSERASKLFGEVSPDILADKSFWLELLSEGGSRCYLSHMPEQLRRDVDVVDALLKNSGNHFPDRYLQLPVDVQQQFLPRLVEAIRSCDDCTAFDEQWGGVYTNLDLMRFPEVAFASMNKGWRRLSAALRDSLTPLPWGDDPEIMLAMARDPPTSVRIGDLFWDCCSPRLRRDKAFLVKALTVGKLYGLERYLDKDLRRDFAIRCAVFLKEAERSCTSAFSPDVELAREARRRLAAYVSLETFLEGVKAGNRRRIPREQQQQPQRQCLAEDHGGGDSSRAPPPTSPAADVTILNQDAYTLAALRDRLRELLGAPTDDQAAVARNVSNVFTRHGY